MRHKQRATFASTARVGLIQALGRTQMSDDSYLLHLNRTHAEGHSKYVYFLLAATGAALGYALQKLDNSTLNWQVWFGLIAIAAWLVSFFCGCRHITTIQSAINSNYQLIQLQQGNHPMQPQSHEEMQIAWQVTTKALDSKNSKAQLFFRLQFWLLAIGVLLFATWRVLVLLGAS
jgi:hypothetical protein